ncbi:hypothetical protein ACWEV4_35125, partial [Streptomyces sp. NPDC003860]
GAPAPKATPVVDLMEALRASVEKAKSPKDSGTKASIAGREQGRRRGSGGRAGTDSGAVTKRRTASARSPRKELEGLTKAELYERATSAGVPGRSHMRRDELLRALAAG